MNIEDQQKFHVDLPGSIITAIRPQPVWCNCVFCNLYVETKYSVMEEGVCYECRNKLLNRIKLIMNFQ